MPSSPATDDNPRTARLPSPARRLFVSVYLGVLLAAMLGLVAAWTVESASYDRGRLAAEGEYVEHIHPMIVSELAETPPGEWSRVLEWWEGVTEFELELLSADDPFWAGHEHLSLPSEGQISFAVHTSTRSSDSWAAAVIPGTDQILYYYYAGESPQVYLIGQVAGYAVVFSVLAGAIYFLLRPIIRSTDDLTSTAQAYGEGRLDRRVKVKGTGPLARLSLQFNRMAEDIQHRIHEQEVMTTAISHELKTPLTRLRLALDMALATEDAANQREMLLEMDEDLDDLDELTAELLTLAKLSYSGETLELQRVALKEIFGRLIPKLSGLEPRVAFSLEGASGAHCLGHEEHLTRAFSNLLINGQRYANSAVKVTFALEDEAVFVSVEDDGAGIPADRRKEVFIPFARLDRSRNRDTGGYGLGLAIAKQSLEVQGASIELTASEMGGARFVVRLPKA